MTRQIAEFVDLTEPQQRVLQRLEQLPRFTDIFFFTGGTLLKALGLVPRQSNDLDFFSFPAIDGRSLTEALGKVHQVLVDEFAGQKILNTDRGFMHEPSGMTIDIVADGVPPIDAYVPYGHLKTASLKDIAASKASAICSRDELKDYIDIAFLTKQQNWQLRDLAALAEKKFQLGTITEEKLFAELVAKQEQSNIPAEIFLRDQQKNIQLVHDQIARLISQTSL